MFNRRAYLSALRELENNPEQKNAVYEQQHCVVLAGPGSGKTKTLVTAIARTLAEDVVEPRGVACITYNNECAAELQTRLNALGINADERIFIGTVHSFALTQVIIPYARCINGLLPEGFKVATTKEAKSAVELAYRRVFNDSGDPHKRWKFATIKRRQEVDRSRREWRGHNPEIADFIEAYETELRNQKLIDFDDMPLLAYRMIKNHLWIRNAIHARYPVLFVDEYQDLGNALHELVLLLCFKSSIRLFAVGDIDQSVYGFTGANPELLESLTSLPGLNAYRLKFNYRFGTKLINASIGALGAERNYSCTAGTSEGTISYHKVNGKHTQQANYVVGTIIPTLLQKGYKPEQIAILYRTATLGNEVAVALEHKGFVFIRTDNNALIKRSSRMGCFIEHCACWVSGGWVNANPSFADLLRQARNLVYESRLSDTEEQLLSLELMGFLQNSIQHSSANNWLRAFKTTLIHRWQSVSRNPHTEWDVCRELIDRTDPATARDIPFSDLAGRTEGAGRIVLSTLHSSKGREFDAVILFGINNGDIPNQYDLKNEKGIQEARRLFYVGATRARHELCLVFQENNHSPWVFELYKRSLAQ